MPSISIVQQYAIPPDQPGGTRHYEFARLFTSLGWTSEIIASDFSHHEKRFFRRNATNKRRSLRVNEEGVHFRYFWIPTYDRNGPRRSFSMMWFSIRAFLHVICSPSDVIYASSPHIFCCLSTYAAARIRQRCFVFEVRDLWPEHFAAVRIGSEDELEYKVMGAIANLLYRRSDLVVIFARGSTETVLSRGGTADRIFLLDGVDTAGLPIRVPKRNLPERTQIVYMGTLGAMYGIQMALDACVILRARGITNFDITFVGDGSDKRELQEFVTSEQLDNIHFRDPIPKAEVARTLIEFDAGLLMFLPSSLFSFGISPQKLFDYMSVNLPVISNVQGDLSRIVKEANAGVVSDGATAEALADAIQEMVNPANYDHVRFQGGREYIDAHANRAALTRQLAERLQLLADV